MSDNMFRSFFKVPAIQKQPLHTPRKFFSTIPEVRNKPHPHRNKEEDQGKKSIFQIPSLPKLIFAENHTDPITGILLKKLTPEFKKLGYNHFYDELFKGAKISYHHEQMKKYKQFYEKLKKDFEALHLDINKESDIKLYTLTNFLMKNEERKMNDKEMYNFFDFYTNHFLPLIQRYPAATKMYEFFKTLEKYKVEYEGVDHGGVHALHTLGLEKHVPLLMSVRDSKMAENYVAAKYPVFGRVGLAHAMGMQKNILKQLTPNAATTGYSFYNVYSNPLTSLTKFEQNVRSGKLVHPLGLKSIFADERSIDKIAESILGDIHTKKEKIATLKQEIKVEEGLSNSKMTLFKKEETNTKEKVEDTAIPNRHRVVSS